MYRFLILFVPVMAGAETVSLPLEALPARVASHHYGLRVARTAIEEAKARVAGAGRLPNPRAGVDWRPQNRRQPNTGKKTGARPAILLSWRQPWRWVAV